VVEADTLRTLCRNRKGCAARQDWVKGNVNRNVNYLSGIIRLRNASTNTN